VPGHVVGMEKGNLRQFSLCILINQKNGKRQGEYDKNDVTHVSLLGPDFL